jgi:hypothetical protein
MAETIPDEDLPSMSLPRKTAASETTPPAESVPAGADVRS